MFPMEGRSHVNNVSPLVIPTLSFGVITVFFFLLISDIRCRALFLLPSELTWQRNLSC